MKSKSQVKVGDRIHIYHMFGEPQYSGREGVVRHIDAIGQIHGSWGGCALLDNDDWEIIDDEASAE